MEVIVYILIAVICTLSACIVVLCASFFRFADKVTNKLMAKDLTDYAVNKDKLDSEPAVEIQKMKVENQLVMEAARLEDQKREMELTGRIV